jgi:hypothetical protein
MAAHQQQAQPSRKSSKTQVAFEMCAHRTGESANGSDEDSVISEMTCLTTGVFTTLRDMHDVDEEEEDDDEEVPEIVQKFLEQQRLLEKQQQLLGNTTTQKAKSKSNLRRSSCFHSFTSIRNGIHYFRRSSERKRLPKSLGSPQSPFDTTNAS